MNFSTLMLLLAAATAAHNMEEWQGYTEWVTVYHSRLNARFKDRAVFRFALILLTVLVLAVALAHYWTGRATVLCKVIVFAILLNAIGHCIVSLYKRRIVPGAITALFLIIPLASAEIYVMVRVFADNFARLAAYAVLSLVLTPVAVYGSLWGGLGAKRLCSVLNVR
jgi:hypothetical protein